MLINTFRRNLSITINERQSDGFVEITNVEPSGADYVSNWRFELDEKRDGQVFGVDRIQSFVLCLKILDAYIDGAIKRGVSVTWNGDSPKLLP